jgi:hypothetical protein
MKSFFKNFCLIYFLLGVGSYFFSANLAIIFFFGLLPSLLACSVDRMSQNYLSRIVVLFNSLGLFVVVLPLILVDKNIDTAAYTVATKPVSWLIVYTCCAIGWVFYFVLPRLIIIVMRTSHKANKKNLELRLAKIYDNINQCD